jgi:hypothetical protein
VTTGRRTASSRLAAAAFAALALGACADTFAGSTPSTARSTEERRRDNRFGGSSVFDMFGGGQVGNLEFGGGRGEGFVGNVNRHIWQASLDTLAFLPIASTDPYSGVISTDWGAAPDTPGERFKVTAFVTSTALDANSLRVAVFRERQGPNGVWVAAPVAPETPRQIEDSILVRARQLRLAERGAG